MSNSKQKQIHVSIITFDDKNKSINKLSNNKVIIQHARYAIYQTELELCTIGVKIHKMKNTNLHYIIPQPRSYINDCVLLILVQIPAQYYQQYFNYANITIINIFAAQVQIFPLLFCISLTKLHLIINCAFINYKKKLSYFSTINCLFEYHSIRCCLYTSTKFVSHCT